MRDRPKRRAAENPYTTLRVCAHCGGRRMLISFPRFPGETRRGNVCNTCIKYPSAVTAAA